MGEVRDYVKMFSLFLIEILFKFSPNSVINFWLFSQSFGIIGSFSDGLINAVFIIIVMAITG